MKLNTEISSGKRKYMNTQCKFVEFESTVSTSWQMASLVTRMSKLQVLLPE